MSDKPLCKNCDGVGTVPTGIEESPEALCRRCDGDGYEQATPPAMNAASPTDGCSLCGAKGIHACMGDMPDWTPEKVAEFDAALCEYESEPGAQGSATSGEVVATYHQRIEADPNFSGVRSKEHTFDYVLAEVGDLRAALAAKAEQSNSAGGGNTPVGKVIANDLVHGWHMEALKSWDEIGEGTLLYAAPVAERAAAPASVPEGWKLSNQVDYEKAVASLNQLLDAGAAEEDHPLADLVDTVGLLISAYEDAHNAPEKVAPAAPEVAPASVPEGDADELSFNAQRLRNVAKLVGLESAVPHDDATLDGARGAVLGLIATKLRNAAAPEAAQPAAQGESMDDLIERAALKHIATHSVTLFPNGDYKRTEQFKRLKAFTAEICNAWGASPRQEVRREALEFPSGTECKCGKAFNECIATSCEHFDLATPAPTAGEPSAKDAVEVAEAVAAEVLHHIDRMYPAMWAAVAKNARLSIRNTIRLQSKRYLAAIAHIKATQGGKGGPA